MLNNSRKSYELCAAHKAQNSLKEWVVTYQPIGAISASIALNTFTPYNQNNLHLQECKYVAFTNDERAQEGMKLNNLLIKFALPLGSEKVLYLEEVKNG